MGFRKTASKPPDVDADQMVIDQSAYWSGEHKRRHPSDPVIADFVQPKLDFIQKHVDLPAASSVLDVGCGNGYFTYYLKNMGRTFGIDYARAMLALNPCANLAQASAFDLPFPRHNFDLVICSNLLHHVSDPLAALTEMKRTSKRYLVVHVPNRNNPAILALGLYKKEERQSLQFTKGFIRSLALQAGLDVLAIETIGAVTPNRMPRAVAKIVRGLNNPNPFGAYIVLVAQKLDDL